jgi:sensor histidine kinase YesM
MNAVAIPWSDKLRRFWRVNLRSSMADLMYVGGLMSILMGYSAWQILTDDAVNFSLADRLQTAGGYFLHWAPTLGLPPTLALTVALRFAPRDGIYRWIVMIMAAVLSIVFTNRVAVLVFGQDPSFDHVAQGLLTVALIATGCAFHHTARSAENTLLHAQIERSSLDAEFTRAQLELLRAQIEPHFLFNTLATVKTLVQVDRRSAADMIDNLLRYFAAALPTLRQSESTLADEIGLVDAYLRIQQVRMGPRLMYELSIPDALLAARVPSVMLLTLVENAIKHGINPASAGGRVNISASGDASTLTLCVADTGQGMQVQQGHGSGLANVRARLNLLYRRQGTLSLEAGQPRGVVATIRIPIGAAT